MKQITNGVMMEYFEENLTIQDKLWQKAAHEAYHLERIGITALWLPPAFKGANGIHDVGYGVYDLYDLGEFDQKWTVGTKYGTRDEYLYAIELLHRHHIEVYPDIVFNHKMGADHFEAAKGYIVDDANRNKMNSPLLNLHVPTYFSFPNRHQRYSDFTWNKEHFNGCDFDPHYRRHIYLFDQKQWSKRVSDENGNYDYLLGVNIDHSHPDVKEELTRFGKWYMETTNLDGFRLDALKHIDYAFYDEWIDEMREQKDLFMVGEYWNGSVDVLLDYLHHLHDKISLFDVPLHYRFYDCSMHPESFDLRNLFRDTLVQKDPVHAVTFVDNHDTAPYSGLSSFVRKWFKPAAYACILLREAGYPCIFYGDYYGLKRGRYQAIPRDLHILLWARKHAASGGQIDYFEDDYQLGWTRQGGLACLFSIRQAGIKTMYVGTRYKNHMFIDAFHPKTRVRINRDGLGAFTVKKQELALYLDASLYHKLVDFMSTMI